MVAPHGAFATEPSAQGTFIVVRFVQPLNAAELIVVGVPSNVIEVKPEQFWNAPLPIEVILDGNLNEAIFSHL